VGHPAAAFEFQPLFRAFGKRLRSSRPLAFVRGDAVIEKPDEESSARRPEFCVDRVI
jgi:hypothetical protein